MVEGLRAEGIVGLSAGPFRVGTGKAQQIRFRVKTLMSV